MKRILFIFLIFILFLNCNKIDSPLRESKALMPDCKFMITSDIHYYNKTLGAGKEFMEYINNDRKLLLLSDNILRRAIDIVHENNPDFLIITGDLTKDGEYINHKKLEYYFNQIEKNGTDVYIINGNHDISNNDAKSYTDSVRYVRTVNADEFKQIYANFGYNEAIFTDEYSLSYIVEPVNGLWLMAIDCCIYNNKRQEPIVDGIVKKQTYNWIEDILIKADELNKYVIVFMHHNLLEHFKGQKKNYGPYVLKNNDTVKQLFAKYNVSIVLTGHFHANDITYEKIHNKFLYDIETGSLLTYPSPIRLLIAKQNKLNISTITIDSIDSLGYAFKEYSKDFTYSGISNISKKILMSLKVNEKDAIKISNKIADIFIKHYSGTENTNNAKFSINNISWFSRFIVFTQKNKIQGIMNDNTPFDNNYTIDLSFD